MATYNLGNTGVVPTSGLAWQGKDRLAVVQITVDLSKRTGYNVPSGGYAASDVLQICDLPKGTYVMYGNWELVTAEGSAATFTLASTGTAVTYVTAGASLNGTPATPTVFSGTSTGLHTADSVLTMTLAGTLTNAGTAKIVFHLVVAYTAIV